MIEFLHYSDPHLRSALMTQTHALGEMMKLCGSNTKSSYKKSSSDIAGTCICTGDITNDCFEDGISGLDLSKCLHVVGNHDCILESGTDPSGYLWRQQPSATQLYNRYFSNYITSNGITMNSNTTYWYKTLNAINTKETVTIIGLNSQARGSDNDAQNEWLRSILYNSNRVLIASHYPNSKLHCVENSWLDYPYYPSLIPDTYSSDTSKEDGDVLYPAIMDTYNIVNEWADVSSNHRVIAWICGHEHADSLFIGGKNNKYPFITIAATIPDRYSNLYRSESGTIDGIVANYMKYINDEYCDYEVLKIYRLGAGGSKYGAKRRCCVWGYNEQNWIEWLDRSEF